MKRAEIRKAVAGALAALGYPREWYEWPKHRPGRLYLLMRDEVLSEHRLAAPMTKTAFRAWLRTIPRRGPALVYKSVTAVSWRQPDLEHLWALPAIAASSPASSYRVDVRGHKDDEHGPPRRATKGRGR